MIPKTRTERTNYADGGWCEQDYVGDELHGRWVVYYPDGKVKWEREYVRDRQTGAERTYDEAGNLVEEQWFHEDQLHGTWRKAGPDGTVRVVGEFLHGHPAEDLDDAVNPDFTGSLRPLLDVDVDALDVVDLASRLARPTIALEPGEPLSLHPAGGRSYVGAVTRMGAGESWPRFEGRPLAPLLQIACAELPARPEPWDSFDLLTLFAVSDNVPQQLGEDIVVRTYSEAASLEVVEPPRGTDRVVAPCRLVFQPPATSYPDPNDMPPAVLDLFLDRDDLAEVIESELALASRISGWPGWMQSERLMRFPRFAFQVDSLMFPRWRCGDSTVHYFFRPSRETSFEWIAGMT